MIMISKTTRREPRKKTVNQSLQQLSKESVR